MKIKDINHMTPSVSSHNMIKESDESESNEGIWYDFDNVEDFIDSVDVKKFAYDITNHASFSEALNDYTVNDYENNEFGERTISWTLPDSGIDLAIRFDFPTFTDLTDFANSNYTKEDFMSHVEDVWSITDPNSNYNDFWSDMDELLSPSDYGYSEYTTDNDYDVNVSPTSIKFNNDGLCIDNDFHILEKVSTDLNFVKIPNDIALIKCFAFDGCSKLTDIVITGHIKYIDRFAFAGAVNLKNVYYVGSKKDWHKIKIGRDNENLTNANIHYNYKGSYNESLNGGTDMKIKESKSIKESLNEATTDRIQSLLNIIDKSFEVDEDTSINEEILHEDNKIRLSAIPGVTRNREGDFTDDGNRFQAYLYKGLIPITYLRADGEVYITIAFHDLANINYEEYKEFPSYTHADDFNGVSVGDFDPQVFKKNLDAAYDDVIMFLDNVEEVDSQQLEDRIKIINSACKEYEEKVKQYIKDNALNIIKLSDYKFSELKNYVTYASNKTADAIRDASASSQRSFMSYDIEKLKERISNSWNFKYIKNIINSVKESFKSKMNEDIDESLKESLLDEHEYSDIEWAINKALRERPVTDINRTDIDADDEEVIITPTSFEEFTKVHLRKVDMALKRHDYCFNISGCEYEFEDPFIGSDKNIHIPYFVDDDIDESVNKTVGKSLKESIEPQTSYEDAKQLVKNIDKFLKEIEENGVRKMYFSSDDLDALHKGRDAIIDFIEVYEENENHTCEYKLAFKPVNDVADVDCTNGLISTVRSAGFNYHSARKLAGDYYITIICKPEDLSRAKLAIENCGFFKSWLESNESIKPKSSKLTLVNESNVFRFTKNKNK